MITVDVLPNLAFLFILTFARLGSMMMVLPALGEQMVPRSFRLSLAILLTLVMLPVLEETAQPLPLSMPALIVAVVREIIIGVAIGLIVRMVMGAVQVAGTTIAFQIGLGFAQNVDPAQGIQGAIFSNFLTMLAILLIFATDTHHFLIAALYDSYRIFPQDGPILTGDWAELAIRTVTGSFQIALQMAAPFVVFGLIFYLGMGILSRLIPQLQIFFLALPVNILLGFGLTAILLTTMMTAFLDQFSAHLDLFVSP